MPRLLGFQFTLAVAVLAVACGGNAPAPSKHTFSHRLVLLAHRDPGGSSADVFGHRGYAYLSSARGRACRSPGVRIYDLRTPRRPRRVATFADGRSEPRTAGSTTEKTIVQHVSTPSFTGELAVTAFQRCRRRSGAFQGFGLYDVTKPRRPRRLALVPLRPRGSHEIWLQARGGRAYVYTAILRSEVLSAPSSDTPGRPDFRIFDVTRPTRPVKVGGWGAWRELGIHPISQGRENYVHSVITNRVATRAYLSYWDLGTVILDIRDPTRPRYLGRTSGSNAHSAALARNESVLVETHETANGRPTLYDVAEPRSPRKLSIVRLPDHSSRKTFTTGAHDPKVRGRRAFFSWFRRGVVAVDISRPSSPRVLAQFVPAPDRDVTGARLCKPEGRCPLVWGVYRTRRYVLASDMNSGLWVLQLRRGKR